MPRPGDPEQASCERERQFFDEIVHPDVIRVAARSIVLHDDHVLIARLAHDPENRHFPGGALEAGESLEGAIRRELFEETSIEIASLAYRFVANNRFEHGHRRFHFVEHYFEVTAAHREVVSKEDDILLEWIPRSEMAHYTIHPIGVRDSIVNGTWRHVRMLEVS